MSDNDYEVQCPMQGCDEPLLLSWTASLALVPEDLDGTDDNPVAPDGATVQQWQIGCVAGHVILLPGPHHCPCEDPDGAGCPAEHQDAYDWDEEYRTFRANDWPRLRATVEALRTQFAGRAT